MITPTELEQYTDISRRLHDRIEVLAVNVAQIRNISGKFESYTTENDGTIEIMYADQRCSCCGPEYEIAIIPVSYLWTPNFVDVERAAYAESIAEAARQKEINDQIEAEDRRVKREQAEWQTYQRLSEKFKDIPERTK